VLNRLAEPENISNVIAFPATDDARWITGDAIRVDGEKQSLKASIPSPKS
jgi:NAD(P)-dependent dehydrogenase (short-subunit alcohol dehydrogenase family)